MSEGVEEGAMGGVVLVRDAGYGGWFWVGGGREGGFRWR